MRKSLKLLIGGALVASMVGCGNPQYAYEGMIGNERVNYVDEGMFNCKHVLTVLREGKIIKFVDVEVFGEVDGLREVIITDKRGATIYSNNEIGRDVLREGKKQYEEYLAKIIELKRKKGLIDIHKK